GDDMITIACLTRLSARALTVPVIAVALSLNLAIPALAASGYTLFGDAMLVPGGNPWMAAQLRSDATPGFGGVDFDVSSGLTFAQLTQLSTDYNITDDQCGAGSPRFQINVSTASGTKNIFVYLGPSPSFTGCAPGWQSSGNLIGNNDPCRFDTSQVSAGTQCNTYSGALALAGGLNVTGIQLVVDSGWNAVASVGDGEQTNLVDNVRINSDTYTFDEAVNPSDKAKCKKGGWQDFTSSPGPFKNQGDCVSYFATGGRNKGSGD
ncbi:MAG: hypothetical protein ACRDF9_13535, partial [Candidatus Limnocylindria bacterium]